MKHDRHLLHPFAALLALLCFLPLLLAGCQTDGDNLCTVTFDTNGGEEIEAVTVTPGSLLSEPQTPTRPGYRFAGWYEGDRAWNFTQDTVRTSLTLTAHWQEKEDVSVVVFTNQGNTQEVEIARNGLLTPPDPPVRADDEFLGWYGTDGELWDFSQPVTVTRLVLYAKWSSGKNYPDSLPWDGVITLPPISL